MGLKQSNIDEKKLAETLGLDVEAVTAALKESRVGGFARLWSVEDKGNYSVARISTSKKPKGADRYETDFQDGFVSFLGSAHEKAKGLNVSEKGVTIQIFSCEVTTYYSPKTEKIYTNYVIYSFDTPNGGGDNVPVNKKFTEKEAVVDEQTEDDLPF